MSSPSENIQSFEIENTPNDFVQNESFQFKPDYESPLPSYQDLQSYLEDALRKQISLQYLLGIHKLHDMIQERALVSLILKKAFFNIKTVAHLPNNLNKSQKNEILLLKEHLNEEILRVKEKQLEFDHLREKMLFEPWDCLKDPNKLYERMVLKQEDLWNDFQSSQEQPILSYPKQEKLWGFLPQNTNDSDKFREILYQYQEFLMQEHVKLDLLKQKLGEESEKARQDEVSFEKNKMHRMDYEIFEETKEKIKQELNVEREVLNRDKRKINKLVNIIKNYLYFKENKEFDWENTLEDFLQELFHRIKQENDIFEKDPKKKQQRKRLNDEIQCLLDENLWAKQPDPYENIGEVLGNINCHKETSQEDELQRKLFKRKEEMMQHKQKELESLKKLLEKESLILQEEKIWLSNEKKKIAENTKKKIEVLLNENQGFRDEIRFLKDQNPLQNISNIQNLSNIVPSNSNLKSKSLTKQENYSQFKAIDDFQATECFVWSPQIRKMALFTLANWLDYSIDINISKPFVLRILGFYKWKIQTHMKDLPITLNLAEMSLEENAFLKKKWLVHQANLISQRRYPYNSLNKQRKALEESFFDYDRKKFWKSRFLQLFGSVFRQRRRKEKIIYLVGFYKFCLHSLLNGNKYQKSYFSEKMPFRNSREEKKSFVSLSNYETSEKNEINEPILFEKSKRNMAKETETNEIIEMQKNWPVIFEKTKNNYKNKQIFPEKPSKEKEMSEKSQEIKEKYQKNQETKEKAIKSRKINEKIKPKMEKSQEINYEPSETQEKMIDIKSLKKTEEEEEEIQILQEKQKKYQLSRKERDLNKKLKSVLIMCLILVRRSTKNSPINKKGNAWIRWMRWNLIQERQLMNNELNDLNILLGEKVCSENQRIMNLRLKKNDLDSRISVLAQMMTCLKVNIFQKNMNKLKKILKIKKLTNEIKKYKLTVGKLTQVKQTQENILPMKDNQFNGVSQVNFNNDLENFMNLDDNLKLTRQYIKEENEWKKTKAILEQKIELMKLEIEDSKKREENLHKMNETILSSLNDLANDSNKASTSKIFFKDLIDRIDEYNKEFLEKKEKTWEIDSKYEKENKQLKDTINELQMKLKENDFIHEKSKIGFEHKLSEFELLNKKFSASEKNFEDEKKKMKDIQEKEFYNRNEEFSREVEIIKQKNQIEIERMRKNSSFELNELKELYRKEKAALDLKLDRLERDLKEYRRLEEENLQNKQEVGLYSEQHLNQLVQEISETKDFKIKELENINYELTKKIQNLERMSQEKNPTADFQEILNLRKENSQLNKTIMDLKFLNSGKKFDNHDDNYQQIAILREENDENYKEITALRKENAILNKTISDLRKKANLQQEDSFINLKHASDYQEMIGLRKENLILNKTITELRKNEETQEDMNYKFKQKDTRLENDKKSENIYKSSKKNKLEEEDDELNISAKDQHRYFKYSSLNSYQKENQPIYKTPTKQANDHSRVYHLQQEEYNNKRSPIKNFQGEQKRSIYLDSRDRSMTSNNVNVMDLMKSTTSIQYKAQEIVEGNFDQDEIDTANQKNSRKHYRNFDERGIALPVPYEDFVNNKNKKLLKEQDKINEDILNILMQLNKEKSFIEEKLAELEKRLANSENINENLLYEKEKLKNDLVKIYQEVKIAKSGLGDFEEIPYNSSQNSTKKNQAIEKDANLKTEIKFLINKLLKAKGKLVKEKTDLSFKGTSPQKIKNYYSNSSNYEFKRSSEKKENMATSQFENNTQPVRSRTPILYQESRKKAYFNMNENVSHI